MVGTWQFGGVWGFRVEGFDTPTSIGIVDGPPCWLHVPKHRPILLEKGDFVLLTRTLQYRVSSSPDVPCEDFRAALRANEVEPFDTEAELEHPLHLTWGASGPWTRLIGVAFMLENPRGNPLRDALPELIMLRGDSCEVFPWVRAAIEDLSTTDAESPGFATVARSLAELIFVRAMRTHLLSSSSPSRGWLRGLTDPSIAQALRSIHANPGSDWTVATLAYAAGLSRSIFAVRFAELVGATPIAYLTQWRMHLAAERIAASQPNLNRLAYDLGYTSDSAFRHAFKSHYGVPPSRFAVGAERPACSPGNLRVPRGRVRRQGDAIHAP